MAKKITKKITKKIAKLDDILDSLEDWCRNHSDEERFPGPLKSVLKAKRELKALREKVGG